MLGAYLCLTALVAYIVARSVKSVFSEDVELWTRPEDLLSVDVVRNKFTSTVMPKHIAVKDHTHPQAAALRSTGRTFAIHMARNMGVSPYMYQMSSRDQRDGLKGCRMPYWAKDLQMEERYDEPSSTDLITLIDVDYYVNMHAYLTDNFQPVLLYTVCPEAAADSAVDNSAFTFVGDEMEMRVSGGAVYRHEVWDYSGDCVIAEEWKPVDVLGVFTWYKFVQCAYLIDRRRVSKHRYVICLTPLKRRESWFGKCSMITGKTLGRYRVCDGAFSRLSVLGARGEVLVSTARQGTFHACTVDSSVDDAIAVTARRGKTDISIPSVASWIESDKVGASILVEYHSYASGRGVTSLMPSQWTYFVGPGVRTYKFQKDGIYDIDSKAGLVSYMLPLWHGAYAPAIDVASEERCVKGRIEEVKAPTDIEPDPFLERCMCEFVDLLCGDAVLTPVDHDYVYNKQARPQQRRLLFDSWNFGKFIKRCVKAFNKKEAYAKPADPRNISTVHQVDKVEWARFMYAFGDFLKEKPFYAFGRTPKGIAKRVAEICTSADFVVLTDFSRMDGRVSGFLRTLEHAVCMRLFPHHRGVVNELLRSQYGLKGFLPLGTTYETGTSRLSGSAETSAFNTLCSAFVAYVAIRRTRGPDGRFYGNVEPREAYRRLGVYGGDDGFTADVSPEQYEWAAKAVGQKLTSEVVKRGNMGVNFLSRFFSPWVWEGGLDSCCDLPRMLKKLHTTVRKPDNISPVTIAIEKCRGILATDPNTPIVSEFARRVMELAGEEGSHNDYLNVRSWWSAFEPAEQFPNEDTDMWMESYIDGTMPKFSVNIFRQWLGSCELVTDLLHAPLCHEISRPEPGKVPVMVEDEQIDPPAADPAKQSTRKEKRKARGRSKTKRKHGETLPTTTKPSK